MKIVILDGYTENPGDLSWDGFRALGDVTVYDRTAPGDIARRIGDAEIVYTNKTPLTAETIGACPGLRFIGVLATGFNVVDGDAARARGIPVANIPSYGTEAVGQFAIAMLLAICHRVEHHSNAVHEGRWTDCPDFCFWDTPQIELAGKTMGIVGFGRIGQVTGRIARALGMRVIAFDEFETDAGRQIAEYVPLEELYREADVVALHCPLTADTTGMIDKRALAQMKKGVIVLNNSRGPLIVERDLADALISGHVYAAALDVVSTEPIAADNPLLAAPNCLITPHISWAARESRERLMNQAVRNLQAFLAGAPINVVNG